MKKFTSIIRLLTITSALSGGLAYASPLSEEQIGYLDYIEGKIQAYVVFSTEFGKNFISVHNKESYRTHVNRFNDKFAEFKSDVVDSLRAEKQKASDSLWKQILDLMYDIVITSIKPAEDVHKIFKKHCGTNPNPLLLGKDLASTEKYIEPEFISPLQAKVRRLQSILNTIYQSLAKKIDVIIESLEQRKNKQKQTMIEGLNALKHRVTCK